MEIGDGDDQGATQRMYPVVRWRRVFNEGAGKVDYRRNGGGLISPWRWPAFRYWGSY